MKVKTDDCLLALLLLAVCAVFYQQSTILNLPVVYALGPVFFPRILIGILAALSLVLLFQSVNFSGRKAQSAKVMTPSDAILLRWGMVSLLAAYVLALPLTGYLIATVLFLFAEMCLLGPRKSRTLVVYGMVSGGVTLGLYYLFGSLLQVFLP